jgi:spoIIIJ-associated protein
VSSVEWVETTGKTVEEAQEAALDQLGIDHDDAEFEILEEPRAGLFGRVRGEARIRARVAPKAPRPKQDRRPRRKARTGNDRGRGRGEGAGSDEGRGSEESTEVQGEQEQRVSDEANGDERRDGDRRRASRDGGGRRSGSSRPREDDDRPILSAQEEGELVAEFLRGLVGAFALDAEVRISPVDEDTVQVDVDGDELGLLVGPRGNTLSALHELSRTILQRKAGGGFQGRVRVDVAGYRAKRREALAKFAAQIAEQVISTGKASALEPMNPPDRKVVHDTANEIPGVSTRSEGEEPRRYVVIEPSPS